MLYQPRQVEKELSLGQRLSGAYPAPKGSREPEIRDEEGETEKRGWEAQIRDNRPGEIALTTNLLSWKLGRIRIA